MSLALLVAAVVLLAVIVVLQVVILRRQSTASVAALAPATAALERAQERTERVMKDELSRNRDESGRHAVQLRGEVQTSLKSATDTLVKTVAELTVFQRTQLDEMRNTVNEKLQSTLEQRLSASFAQVTTRLEQVHKGLGEMQALAHGVGDLKRVLTNVKTRGTWGEVQLGALLAQVLSPEQYAENVATKPGSGERVEFAIRLPGAQDDGGACVWLPVDAKFPKEDYERLVDAAERIDADGVELAGRDLETRVKGCARDIRDKYVHPPATTDFAILFLPTEGLYAEVLRRPGLAELLQRDFRVNVAGPTTLGAMLNSLQMGFRTLAIQKRSGEVWTVLGAVKTEFGKFGEVLQVVKKKLDQASDTIDKASTRTRAIERKLHGVQTLPAHEASLLLGADVLDPFDPLAHEAQSNAIQ
jgi:DNA recombination protein RmuC